MPPLVQFLIEVKNALVRKIVKRSLWDNRKLHKLTSINSVERMGKSKFYTSPSNCLPHDRKYERRVGGWQRLLGLNVISLEHPRTFTSPASLVIRPGVNQIQLAIFEFDHYTVIQAREEIGKNEVLSIKFFLHHLY